MDEAKIRLSQKELELVSNAEWILTKNEIINKAKRMLGDVQDMQSLWLASSPVNLPEAVKNCSPKISKGENYRGLPYLILDYPRVFDKANIFAIRTLFWWGNFFSVTLQLSGKYKRKFASNITNAYSVLAAGDYHTSVGDDPWQHHFEDGNYVSIQKMKAVEFENKILQNEFIKLVKRLDIEKWNEAPSLLANYFGELIGILAD